MVRTVGLINYFWPCDFHHFWIESCPVPHSTSSSSNSSSSLADQFCSPAPGTISPTRSPYRRSSPHHHNALSSDFIFDIICLSCNNHLSDIVAVPGLTKPVSEHRAAVFTISSSSSSGSSSSSSECH
ncbi:hypothetical protein PoB_006622700 [Plakobranchus ocellatus]|uniref:Uncharacterized protein n=1 Tax=Plakobranchus ocellatus TaxID=259542 RepID=A0AAV4D691_9GAST|nr:hypothetical protein PoB_006622700 [Plakobranchus ocellatus]